MEIRVLRYFLMVAREENITKAAELLHITQPTLSRQLMQLEEELETKLFKRSNHSIRLTEDGMLLKRRAQEIVQLVDKAENEFRHGCSTGRTGKRIVIHKKSADVSGGVQPKCRKHPLFVLATSQSPGLPEALAAAYNPGICLLALPVIDFIRKPSGNPGK